MTDARQAPKNTRNSPIKIISVALGTGLLGACMAPAPVLPPPPPPPPPPPVVQAVPIRPLPPGGAAYVMQIPSKDAVGQRRTINADLTEDQEVWHFRSAWNVAALNCLAPQFAPITTAYSAYISDHDRALKRVNDRIERVYRSENGGRRAGIRAREQHMTAVYNFFALPPARGGFCNAALDISNRYLAGPEDPIAFARANFPIMEQSFEQFFVDYEQYQRDSAAWDARYGAQYGASQPGWVAVQDARARGVVIPTAGVSAPTTTLAAPGATSVASAQSQTGADVPVVPTNTEFVAQPVVEPVQTDPPAEGGAQ